MALRCWLLIWPSTEQSFGSVTGAWRISVNRANLSSNPPHRNRDFFARRKGSLASPHNAPRSCAAGRKSKRSGRARTGASIARASPHLQPRRPVHLRARLARGGGAIRARLGDRVPSGWNSVKIVRGGLNARVAVDELKDVEQIGAHIVQLSLNRVVGSNAVERPLDEIRCRQSVGAPGWGGRSIHRSC